MLLIICTKYGKNPSWTVDWPKTTSQIFEFWNGHYTRHTFWSCLIRCANMKWIRWVLLKIQSGHHSVHRQTDGQGDTSIPPFQLRWSGGYNKKPWWFVFIEADAPCYPQGPIEMINLSSFALYHRTTFSNLWINIYLSLLLTKHWAVKYSSLMTVNPFFFLA